MKKDPKYDLLRRRLSKLEKDLSEHVSEHAQKTERYDKILESDDFADSAIERKIASIETRAAVAETTIKSQGRLLWLILGGIGSLFLAFIAKMLFGV